MFFLLCLFHFYNRGFVPAIFLDEIKSLIDRGIVEFNLIGQDLASYGSGANDDVFGTGRFPLPEIDENGVNRGTEQKSALSLLLEKMNSVRNYKMGSPYF